MGRKPTSFTPIVEYIKENIRNHPDDVSRRTQYHFGITRQAVNRYFNMLLDQGIITAIGKTRGRSYKPNLLSEKHKQYKLREKVEEDVIWRDDFAPLLKEIKPNLLKICYFGFTEMVNNAIDHSNGSVLDISLEIWFDQIVFVIQDDGVGIFNNLKKQFGYVNTESAILDLSKGKLTTNSENHSGEGIFFTSHMFDVFRIDSNSYSFFVLADKFSWQRNLVENQKGTRIELGLKTTSNTEIERVFDEFTNSEGNREFDKTRIQISLAQYSNEGLVSRSQAKRILARAEEFDFVLFDFLDVPWIGQGFADELFRVFHNNHPDVQISTINENEQVQKMHQHVTNSETRRA